MAERPSVQRAGPVALANMLQGLQGFSLALFTRGLGWRAEEVETFLVDVRREMKDPGIHAYWPV